MARLLDRSDESRLTFSDPAIGSSSYTVMARVTTKTVSANTIYGAGIISTLSTTDGDVGDFFFSVDASGEVNFYNWRTTGADSTGRNRTDTGPIADNSEYHIAATWDGTSSAIYVDGVLQSQQAASTTFGGWEVGTRIGREHSSSPYNWDGTIEDAGIWKGVALNQNEILAAFLGVNLTKIHPGNLVRYYPLSGAVPEPDLSGSGDYATLVNGPKISVSTSPGKFSRNKTRLSAIRSIVAAGGLSIPIAMHHYKQMSGAN